MSRLSIDIGGTYLRSELLRNGKIFKEKMSSRGILLSDYLKQKLKAHPDRTEIGYVPYLKEQIDKKIGKYALSSNLKGLEIKLSRFKNASLEGAKRL